MSCRAWVIRSRRYMHISLIIVYTLNDNSGHSCFWQTSWETVGGKKKNFGKESSENKENREKRSEREINRGRGNNNRKGRGSNRGRECKYISPQNFFYEHFYAH